MRDRFDKDSEWLDKMIKFIFYLAITLIILGVIANVFIGGVILRILHNLGLL